MPNPAPEVRLPAGIANAFLFQICNATSWSLVIGAPMLLYLRNIGASGTVLGITVAMIPLFGALQIPAAKHADRVGYKTFVLRGWATRSFFIFGIAAAAVLPPAFSPRFRIAVILVMLACFAVARGISMCGHLPWMTHLVPDVVRGAFVSRDTTCMYLAVTGAMLFSSAWSRFFPSARMFGGLFLLSYLAALASLFFLRRIPDVQTGMTGRQAVHPPWREMLLYPPFLRYVVFSVVFNAFVAALGVLWVPFMRDSYGASGSLILGLSAYANILSAAGAMLSGRLADRFGSRPLLGVASALIIAGQCLWTALAAGALPRHAMVTFGIMSFGAVGFAVLGVAATRLLMGLVPVTGRSHFFAISSVASSLTLGILPVLWGLALDTAQRLVPEGIPLAAGWTWTPFSMLYAVTVAGLLASQFLRRRLDEPRAVSTEQFLRMLLVESPARLVGRVLNPLRRILPPG